MGMDLRKKCHLKCKYSVYSFEVLNFTLNHEYVALIGPGLKAEIVFKRRYISVPQLSNYISVVSTKLLYKCPHVIIYTCFCFVFLDLP